MPPEVDTRWFKSGDMVTIRSKDPVYDIRLKERLQLSRFEVWKADLYIESSYRSTPGILLGADVAEIDGDVRINPKLIGKIVHGMPTLIARENPHGSGMQWTYLKPALRVQVNDILFF